MFHSLSQSATLLQALGVRGGAGLTEKTATQAKCSEQINPGKIKGLVIKTHHPTESFRVRVRVTLRTIAKHHLMLSSGQIVKYPVW